MDVTTVLIGLLMLAAGLVAGLALGRTAARTAAAQRDSLRADRETLRAERIALDERARAAEAQSARLDATLEHERRAAGEQIARLEEGEQRLRDTFSTLSQEALSRSSREFMTLAETRLKQAGVMADGDLAARQQAIESLVSPLRDALGKVEEQMQTVERERVGSYRALREQVMTMQQSSVRLEQETSQLVTALRAPQIRGRWGELQLEQIIRTAGMVEHCDFVTQASVSNTDGGALRPDLVVRLAGDKNVVVDAKVSFVGFLEAMEARDDTARTTRLRAHARHMREHVDRLADKAYWKHFDPTPEFVVMFVPAEVFLNAALDQDPSLLEHAFERNVVIATPSTLVALLRTVAYTWRQEALAQNAAKIHQLGKELHARLATMGGHFARMGSQLSRTVDQYNQTVASLESRVLVSARKLTELQVSGAELAAAEQITAVPRRLQAPELVASASDALIALPETPPQSRPAPGSSTAGG